MPLFRRYGRPGLLDVVGASAIIAGNPATIARALERTPMPSMASTSDGSWSLAGQLRTLGELSAGGLISPEEFTLAKARLFDASPPRPK